MLHRASALMTDANGSRPAEQSPAATHFLVYYPKAHERDVPQIIALLDSREKAEAKVRETAEYETSMGWDKETVAILEIAEGYDYLQKGKDGPIILG